MIKIIITTIILFIIFIIILLSFNVRIEYFTDNTFVSNTYPILRDKNNNEINPTAWYKFDNPSNIGEDSMNKHNFNILGSGVTYNDKIKIRGSGSASFNGNGSLTGIGANIDNKSFSISLWVFTTNLNGERCFYGHNTTFGANLRNYLHLNQSQGLGNKIRFGLYNDDVDTISIFTNDLNKWVHYAFIFNKENNNNMRIYKNGLLDAEKNARGVFNGVNQTYEIGRAFNTDANRFIGYMDDFRIYGGIALTEDQVFELYAGYKKVGEVIETSTNCYANMTASGAITEIPDPNMNINVISTITKRNDHIYSQSFGNGTITYNLTFSKYFNDDYIPSNLLLRNNKLTAFTIDNYNNNGDYTGIFTKNLPENLAFGLIKYPQKGEFIHIRFPSSITLKRYGFIADPQWISRAPGTWALYAGSRLLETSNVNSTLLVNNTTRLNNNSYCSANEFKYIHDIKDNNTSGNELLFIFPSLASSTSPNNPGRILSFMQLLLFSA